MKITPNLPFDRTNESLTDLKTAIDLASFHDTRHPVDMIRVREFRLRLHHARDLFIAPEFNPFSENRLPISGMEYLFNALKPSQLPKKIRTVIRLPQGQISDGLAEQIRAALARYCLRRIEADRHELASQRWQAFKALQSGILFLGVCLLLSTLADGANFLPEWLQRLGGEGFLIAGWVSLWHPTELLLYEWWPTWRDIQVCKRLMEMEIIVEADPSPSA